MKQQFSLAHLTALKCSTPELVYMAAECGYDYISPRVVNMGLPGEGNFDLSIDPTLYNATVRAMEETGVKIHDIELFRIREGTDLNSYQPAMEVAQKLGAKHILSSVWTPNKELYTERFATLCDMAKAYGLGVQLEFVTWADVSNLNEAKELLLSVNRSNAGIMVDTLHAYRSGVLPQELESCPKEWFNFCHICDGPREIPITKEEMIPVGRDGRLYCGEGSIDIASYLRRLPENIVYSIELPNNVRVAEYGYKEHVKKCIDTAKSYLATNL